MLSQLYIENIAVIRQATIDFQQGFHVFTGETGAGKTTTFYMVVGIVPRDAGNIIIDDDDISLLPLHARARRGIGYLPQEASIFRRLSVYDNLMAVLQLSLIHI